MKKQAKWIRKAFPQPRYPKIAFIRGELYYHTGKVCEMVPRRMPDGCIETFVPAPILPDAVDSANFGAGFGTMDYLLEEDGRVLLRCGSIWYELESRKE